VDPAALVLTDGDNALRLRPKVMELLVAFAEHPGEVLSKQELLDLVWPEVTVGDASLTVAVGKLREALGDSTDQPEFIETIPRRGYRLIAPVSGVESVASAAADRSSRFWLIGDKLQFVLSEGENVIGRAPDAGVRIPSTKVSRHHARIVIDGDQAVLEDLDSKNGTFIGASPVAGPTTLSHGDEIRLGQMAATLRVVAIARESTVTELSREKPANTSTESR
jgi:DNA-binding winged helix-turn-helix (wHTH) protein